MEATTHTRQPRFDAPDDAAEAYELVKNLIFDQVHKFRRKFGGDVDELVGEANLAFMKGHTQYMSGHRAGGAEHDAYHVEIRRWVWFELFDAMRTRLSRKSQVGMVAAGDHVYDFADTTFDSVVWAADMGDDARMAVNMVLEPPLCVAYRAAR